MNLLATAPAVPNIITRKSIASRLENAKNIVEIKHALADGGKNVLFLAVHTAYNNLNHVDNNCWTGKKNVLRKYETNYTGIYKDGLASFDNSVFVLHRRLSDIGSTGRVFKRHEVIFSPEAIVSDSEHGYILPHKNKNGKMVIYATTEEMDAIYNLIDKIDDLKAVFAFGLFRSDCVTRGMGDFAKMLKTAGKDAPVVTSRFVAKDSGEIY